MSFYSDRYCPLCKNDESEVVRAGEKLKSSKKKSKMASASGKSTRDWGKVPYLHGDKVQFLKLFTSQLFVCCYRVWQLLAGQQNARSFQKTILAPFLVSKLEHCGSSECR